jgi:anti-sigma factor RsiW
MPNEDVLSAYLDGECTAAERAWVEEQLATSPEVRAVLDEVRVARAAVRALPMRDAPAEFWSRLLAGDAEVLPELEATAAGAGNPVDLAEASRRRRPTRWIAVATGAAAAALIAAVVLVPQPESVDPPVAAFTEAHAVRSSLQDDAVSSLAPLAVQAGFRR